VIADRAMYARVHPRVVADPNDVITAGPRTPIATQRVPARQS